ncbi:regulatory protein TetR [Syntrophobotulus glycolicus DSM 8271]|uniref:Regulatory protein TetR n=1 Tax=Syntrophobotulus glycolicus (strain DSM 8271 / FlGlyR) TaxID=645991 RepID=F0SX42_SYNGF|nr:TetR/AcrR family transcriptional regulator [Syntrophobotulus glycolicus]ADY55825.1 regulatory protein TetR [Syntrophobotulus glycolicus DSM 8271]
MDKAEDFKPNQAQQWFINALLALMQKKPFNEIQVKELSKKADLDRRTFYRYFKSKEEVLSLHCRVVIEDFAKKILNKSELSFQAVTVSYFQLWHDHIDFLKLLKQNNMIYFFADRMDQLIYEHVSLKVKPYMTGVNLDHKTRYHFFYGFGGLWHVLNRWISEEPRETPEEMGQIILEYITEIYHSLEPASGKYSGTVAGY